MSTNQLTPEQLQSLRFYDLFVKECPSAQFYIYTTFHKGYLTQAQLELFIQRISEPRRVLPIYGYVLSTLWRNNHNLN